MEPDSSTLAPLLAGWLRARSVARGLPPPVPDRGGWRVDTMSGDEIRRHVFAAPLPGLAQLGREVATPGILLKLCGDPATLRALLPPRWTIQPQGYLMTAALPPPAMPVPPGYALRLAREGAVTQACIAADDGTLAASGWAAEAAGCFVFDRIVTAPGHRRRGLGSALIRALAGARRSADATFVLVATAEGLALYRTLGWELRSLFTTAAIAP